MDIYPHPPFLVLTSLLISSPPPASLRTPALRLLRGRLPLLPHRLSPLLLQPLPLGPLLPPPSSTTGSEDPASSPLPVEVSNPSNPSVPASDSIKEEALNAHNSFRALHGADALTWDETLVKYAANWTSGCVFEHSNGPYGGASSHGLPLVIEDTYVLQRTWLLELLPSPSPTGSTCGRVKPRTMTPKTLNIRTSPRLFGRTPRISDVPLSLVLLDPSTQRSTECVSFNPLLSIDLTREFRAELSIPFLQLQPTRQLRW